MAYEDLTIEQQRSLDDFCSMLRPWCGEQAKSQNHCAAINDQYNANVSAIFDLLDAADVIPNKTGLSGAVDLTKNDLISIVSHMQNILSGFNTAGHRQLWTRAAGAANMIG